MASVLILGAKSDIAKAVAKKYASAGYDLYLAARNANELDAFAKDVEIRTQKKVICVNFDVLDTASHQAFFDGLENQPQGVVCVIGYLGEQTKAEVDFDEAEKITNTNYTGVVSILNVVANYFASQQAGFIVGISSVAGDRGRKSNYIYGAAKAAMSAYLSGLRNRLFEKNVQVITVKPGFVNTKMTEGMDLPEKLTAEPEAVAEAIYQAQVNGKDVIYTKWIWRWIMLIIKNIPERIFKKLSL